jgi:hypothetical protein
VKLPFESAGMFEVLGYENDSIPLFLKDGKTLRVNFLSDNDENRFNVYYLDTVAKRWNFKEHETRKHREDLEKLNRKKSDFLAKHHLDDPEKLITPKKANISLDNFAIDYSKEEFPELAVYEGVKFEVAMNESNYNSEFKNTVWEDVFISRHPDGKNYLLTFKLKNKKTSITALPVFDEQNYEAAMKQYESIRLHQARLVQAKADSLSKLDQQFSAEEIASNSINARFNAFVSNGTVYRNIVIGQMGIWNYDVIARTLGRARILFKNEATTAEFPKASFVSEDNKQISTHHAYLITRTINAAYLLQKNEISRFPLNLKNEADAMIIISEDKRVFYLKDEELKKTGPVGTGIAFKLKEFKGIKNVNGLSLDQLRTTIGI